MPDRITDNRHVLPLPEAAQMLQLSVPAVEALLGAGYLATSGAGPQGPEFPIHDLKAFVARNADNGSGNLFSIEPSSVDPQDLLDALDGKSEEMARRALDIFTTVFPEATSWSMKEQARFIEQAKGRFEAILAVTGQGAEVDEALVGDLQEVGANAAWSGSPLPQLLVILRISRDLVVQTAGELGDVIVPLDPGSTIEPLVSEPAGDTGRLQMTVARPDGVRRVLDVRTQPRRVDNELVGFQGVIQDVTTSFDLEADKNEFLALVT